MYCCHIAFCANSLSQFTQTPAPPLPARPAPPHMPTTMGTADLGLSLRQVRPAQLGLNVLGLQGSVPTFQLSNRLLGASCAFQASSTLPAMRAASGCGALSWRIALHKELSACLETKLQRAVPCSFHMPANSFYCMVIACSPAATCGGVAAAAEDAASAINSRSAQARLKRAIWLLKARGTL